ncbi:MAG TPA: hypothetical protein VFX02_04000 [Gammaproteobacteria bacterium]|nr:hypothetical protein [Gammaproteobacteria bacterium]
MSREIISKHDMKMDAPMASEEEDPSSAVKLSGGKFSSGDILKWQVSETDFKDEADAYFLQLEGGKGSDKKQAKVPDSYTDRLLKYVPAEVVALFITLDALVRSSSEIPTFIYWAIFLFCTAATYLYLWRVAKVRKHCQLAISTVAFVVWVFALGGPFTHFDWYSPIYGGLLLPIFTFAVALYEA